MVTENQCCSQIIVSRLKIRHVQRYYYTLLQTICCMKLVLLWVENLCQMSEQGNGFNGAVWRQLHWQLWPCIGKFRFHIYIPGNVVFFRNFLHIVVVKLFPHIHLEIFQTSSTLSNYLSNSISRLASALALEQYSSHVLAQHIDDGEYVVWWSLLKLEGTSRRYQFVTDRRILGLWCAFAENFFSPERAISRWFDVFRN